MVSTSYYKRHTACLDNTSTCASPQQFHVRTSVYLVSDDSANCANVQSLSDSNTKQLALDCAHSIRWFNHSSIDSAYTSASMACALVIVWKLNSIECIEYLHSVVYRSCTLGVQLRGSIRASIRCTVVHAYRDTLYAQSLALARKGFASVKKLCAKKFREVLRQYPKFLFR